MIMEGYFHQQVCPKIDKNIQIDKMNVETFQGRHFWAKTRLWDAPLPRKGFVKLTKSVQFPTI
jgi:hypothetical protein